MNQNFSTCGICHGKIGLKPCNCVLQNNKHDLGIAESIGFDKGYKAATAKTPTEIDYVDFLPIWKEFIKDANSVLNVQMVAHHFYNLALKKAQEK